MMQVKKVWWDGDKVMAEPIDPASVYKDGESAQRMPVALKWQQAPIRTAWGDEMVVASVAIDNDHTLSLYCEREQTPKVESMLAQRPWVGLTHDEYDAICDKHSAMSDFDLLADIQAKLREKNQ